MSLLRELLLDDDRGQISVPINAALMVILSALLLALPDVGLLATLLMLILMLVFVGVFISMIFDDEITLGGGRLALAGALVLVCITVSFAGVYHAQSQSQAGSFTARLSRVQSVYFAIGTMSTAGTNGVRARSSGAQKELAFQELVDIGALALLFGGVIRRLSLQAVGRASRTRERVPRRSAGNGSPYAPHGIGGAGAAGSSTRRGSSP
jgi:hypothetical protein